MSLPVDNNLYPAEIFVPQNFPKEFDHACCPSLVMRINKKINKHQDKISCFMDASKIACNS